MTAHQLGADDDPDVFAVGFSSSDIIGHTYGMDSQEQMDEYLRLDLTLGRLFDEIDRRVGLDRVIIGLSADHGAMPLVENLVARRGAGAPRARRRDPRIPSRARWRRASGRRTAWSHASRRRTSISTSKPSRGAGGRAATWRRCWRRRSWRRASSRRCTRRAAAGRPAEGRSLLRAHAALFLRAAQPAGDRRAQGRALPVRPSGGIGPRHALRVRPARARRVHGRLREARHLPRRLRARGHRADPGRAASPGLSAAGRGPRAHRDDRR